MDSLYSRYAEALFSIAKEENQVEKFKNDIKVLKSLFNENEEFLHLLSSRFIEKPEIEKIIDDVLINQNINIVNFIKVIVNNRRVDCIDKIFNEFIQKCNEELLVKDGIIYSYDELSKEEVFKITKALEIKLGSKVELSVVIDKRLLGGVKVVVEDKIFDGSVKNKLEKLKETLISRGDNNEY